jgi:hypothetical protein
MAIKRRRVEGLVLDTDHDLNNAAGAQTVKLSLGAKYAKLVAIRARNWASSAKAGAGTDTAQKLRITDANGDVVYLDAADRDYATAEVTLNPTQDDTATGLGVTPVDATGAAATAGAGAPIILEGPVLVAVVNGGTATDFFTCDLFVEV